MLSAASFPGMNPFLESYVWPGFHSSLAQAVKHQLNKILPLDLVAEIAVSFYGTDIQLDRVPHVKPDTYIQKGMDTGSLEEPVSPYGSTLTPATLEDAISPRSKPREKHFAVKITKPNGELGGELIAAVEILSPTNKKGEDLSIYRRKRTEYYYAGVHLLEIDLLRGGKRPVYKKQWPKFSYSIQLVDALKHKLRFWGLNLQDTLPVISLPLRAKDDPVMLNLQKAIRWVFESSRYEQSLEYWNGIPGPPLSPTDQEFIDSIDK